MFYHHREDTRALFFSAWGKARNSQPLQPLEQQIVAVIAMHPEYHALLEQPQDNRDNDFAVNEGQANPFLHMGLHIAIQEQFTIDQPSGIRAIYQKILNSEADAHRAEHQMMDCLAQTLWRAQVDQLPPDMVRYLDCLQRL